MSAKFPRGGGGWGSRTFFSSKSNNNWIMLLLQYIFRIRHKTYRTKVWLYRRCVLCVFLFKSNFRDREVESISDKPGQDYELQPMQVYMGSAPAQW